MTIGIEERLSSWALIAMLVAIAGLVGWGGHVGDRLAGFALTLAPALAFWRRSVLGKRRTEGSVPALRDAFPVGRIDWPSLLCITLMLVGMAIFFGGWALADPLTPARQICVALGCVMLLASFMSGTRWRRKYIEFAKRSEA